MRNARPAERGGRLGRIEYERPERFPYLGHMNAAMQLQVDCIMKTIIFGIEPE